MRNAQTQLGKLADGLKLALAVSPEKDPFIYVGRSKLLADYIQSEPSFLVLRTLDRAHHRPPTALSPRAIPGRNRAQFGTP